MPRMFIVALIVVDSVLINLVSSSLVSNNSCQVCTNMRTVINLFLTVTPWGQINSGCNKEWPAITRVQTHAILADLLIGTPQ